MIKLARVVKVDWKSHMVDIVMSDDGRAISGVRVMSPAASTNTGFNDLPKPDVTPTKEFKTGGSSKTRDIIAVVSFFNGLPVVLGFLHPQVSQMMFSDEERMIYRHASDVYQTIDKSGNMELAHPSGAYIRMGEAPQHEDLTGKDFDAKWKISRNTGKKIHIHIEQAGGLASIDIAPNGAITINTSSTISVVASGPASVESRTSISLAAPTVTITATTTINGDTTINGAVTVNGAVSAAGDVTAGGISGMGHTHSDAQSGNTGVPQ